MLTRSRWADVATVTLLVGESKTVFHVHEAKLFEASSFFKVAFTSDFGESSERTMTLPEDDGSVFGLFVDWLYHRRYSIASPPVQDASEDYDSLMQPVQLYALADEYDVPDLRSLILCEIFAFIQRNRSKPTLSTVAYAYAHTSQNAAVRTLLADCLVRRESFDWYHQVGAKTWFRAHPEIAVDELASYYENAMGFYDTFNRTATAQEYLNQEQQNKK